ncbi:hypothetical protein P3690_09680 [Vibrio parahaemolyticus]|nr:unknow [Vibrio campbellii]MDF5476273.1 hypothetical protein [Vibrio parahaemolyticus]MDF5487571.1 hypothetical protein [Vibrio parahaemolyticus]MDF5504098.1 hypothetical protein [Vibrio parahaemolyticus]MDF5545635.1 hypothetical protein [Vibrio parahaemolyticus]
MELPAFLFFFALACLLCVGGIFIYAVLLIWQLCKAVEEDVSEY